MQDIRKTTESVSKLGCKKLICISPKYRSSGNKTTDMDTTSAFRYNRRIYSCCIIGGSIVVVNT